MATIAANWTRLASSARLRRSSQSISVLGSRLWIFGGELLPREPVDNCLDVVRLDPGYEGFSETLRAPADAPSPRVGTSSTILRGSLYLFSGRGGLDMAPIEEKGALWRYTPAQSQWSLVTPIDTSAPYPAGRSYYAMTSDGENTIYIHAGCPEHGRLLDLWSFYVETRVWAALPPAPPPARGGASIAFYAGKLYRVNGFDGTCEQGGAIDVYDPSDRTWSSIFYESDGVSGPEARSVSALVTVKVRGKYALLTFFGERDPSSLGHAGAGKMLGDVWAFDLEREKWIKIELAGDAPAPRGWFGADVTEGQDGNSAVIVHGGLAEDNSRLGDVWKLHLV
ncbi:hypothetical protein RB599_010263 [Gaeumannomyces hyphopodioides]